MDTIPTDNRYDLRVRKVTLREPHDVGDKQLVSHHQSMHCGPPDSLVALSLVKRSKAVQRLPGGVWPSSIRLILAGSEAYARPSEELAKEVSAIPGRPYRVLGNGADQEVIGQREGDH